MSWTSATILKAFCETNSILTRESTPTGLAEAILQADGIIQTYTGKDVPDNPSDGHPVLRNIACSLVIWFTTGMLTDLTEQEYYRRKKLYDDAISTLKSIQTGELSLERPSSSESYVPPFIQSTQRIDDMF